ncbi:MAG: antitoxin VapB family protein [Promethearchaeota archaeon]
MASKTISVTEKVYNLLSKMKLANESYGDTIERLCSNFMAENLLQWFDNSPGWEDMDQAEFEETQNIIRKFQQNFTPEWRYK